MFISPYAVPENGKINKPQHDKPKIKSHEKTNQHHRPKI